MRCIILLFFVSINFTCGGQDTSSNELNFSIGVGVTDWYNLAVKYQLSQMQVGLSYGTSYFHDSKTKVRVLSIYGYKHLFGHSKWTDRKPWFVRSGVSYFRREYDHELLNQIVHGTFYFGRDINLNHRIGVAISVGPAVRLYSRYEYDQSGNILFLMPGFDVNLFYRFL